MAVFRVNKTSSKNFTIINNEIMKDKELSLNAKGLLIQMLSLPEDWNYTINGLASINKETETKIKRILDELKEVGYLVVTKLKPNETNTGRYEYIYDIYEEKTRCQKQGVVLQGVVEQGLVFNTLNKINNNKVLNNKINNNIINNIVEYLNSKANTHYKTTTNKTQSLIKARLNEGFNENDFKIVIDKKVDEWLNTKMSIYLRPETLFGNKFESYLNQTSTIKSIRDSNKEFFEKKRKEIQEEMNE